MKLRAMIQNHYFGCVNLLKTAVNWFTFLFFFFLAIWTMYLCIISVSFLSTIYLNGVRLYSRWIRKITFCDKLNQINHLNICHSREISRSYSQRATHFIFSSFGSFACHLARDMNQLSYPMKRITLSNKKGAAFTIKTLHHIVAYASFHNK